MKHRTVSIVFPALLITIGVAWLLTVENVDPRIHWLPVLGMAVVGLLTLLVGGVNKVTVFVGPFLLIMSGFALARQTGRIDVEHMIPCLIITAGVLMFVSSWAPVPYPHWLTADGRKEDAGQQHPKKLRLSDYPAPPVGAEHEHRP